MAATDNVLLVADDEPFNRTLIKRLLDAENYHEVVFVENGVQALEALRAGSIDLVLLDIIMPKKTNTIEKITKNAIKDLERKRWILSAKKTKEKHYFLNPRKANEILEFYENYCK